MRLCLGAAAAVLIVLAVLASPATAAGPPTDYTKVTGLSQPTFGETVREVFEVPMHDGINMYVEVVRPVAAGQYPVILEASPYHGTLADRDGTRILPEPRDEDGRSLGLTGYFAPRGYAVVMADLRGTGRSEGCLDHIGQNDAKDLKDIVEWAGTQSWSNGRVGMTGHSYVGSTPSAAAAQDPEHLVTIVPSAGLASMYDHQFQHGVPYFLQWAGPIEAYEQLAIQRHLPPAPPDPFGLSGVVGPTGDSFGKGMEYFGCGLPNSAAVAGEDQLSGRYADWHAQRDHSEGATNSDIPVFLWHGVNDNAARVSAMEWFTRRGNRPGDKLWLGQWDHGSGCCPTRRGIQATLAMHAWFDKHLAQRDVDTGPPVEIFLSDGTFQEARTGDREQIYTADGWPGAPSTLELTSSGDGTLAGSAAQEGELSYTSDPLGFADPQGTGGVEFAAPPVEQDTLFAGQPELQLSAAVTVPRVYLIANVFDESPDGDRRRITQCAINPELRGGIETREFPEPGERYDMAPPCYAMAHNLRAGHRLVLRVTGSDPDKVPLFSIDPNVTVFAGPGATTLRLPVVDGPTLYTDDLPLEESGVPVGRAQPPISGSVTPAAGAPVMADGVTTAAFEFDVEEGFDNARMVARAVPSQPADIDLYLQRQEPDGSWSEDIQVGGSFSFESETLEVGRLEPGHYRIVVHSWLSPPANEVQLDLTFFNQVNEPGQP